MMILEPNGEKFGHGRVLEIGKRFDIIAIKVVLQHIVNGLALGLSISCPEFHHNAVEGFIFNLVELQIIFAVLQ